MNETIALEQQNNFTTQTLVEGQVLEYMPRMERFFSEEIPDGKLFLNIHIIRWDWLNLPSSVQEMQKVNGEGIIELGKKYFEANKKDLLKRYQNKYIAILNEKVVGFDEDFSKLAERVYRKFGYQTIYMPFVSEQKKIVKIPSPRIGNL